MDTLPKNKGGRPPGSKNLRSRESARVLAALGFDPIAEMVRLHDDTQRLINKENRKDKPSALALSALIAIKQKCVNDLMRYGYARTTEAVEVNTTVLPPMSITLTGAGWKPGDPISGDTVTIKGEPNRVHPMDVDREDDFPEHPERVPVRMEIPEEDNVGSDTDDDNFTVEKDE